MTDIITVATLALTLITKVVEAIQNDSKTIDLKDIQAEISRINAANAADDQSEWNIVHTGKR